MAQDYVVEFECPLSNGLHARPATHLANMAARFAADITLINARNGVCGNAKSVLAMVAADVKHGDGCRVRISGADAEPAHAALREFFTHVLPGCDEPLPPLTGHGELRLPRSWGTVEVRCYPATVGCPGIGWGKVVVANGLAVPPELLQESGAGPVAEQAKLAAAVAGVRETLRARLATHPTPTEADILTTHLAIAEDVALLERSSALIADGNSAARAIVDAASYFAQRLKSAESGYVRERAIDVEDIAAQLLERIYGDRIKRNGITLTEPAIVVAENLTPRQILELDRRLVKGLVLEHAGATSHAVILARSFNIPTLTGLTELRAKLCAGQEAVVDGYLGAVVVEPPPLVQRYYARQVQILERRSQRLARHTHAPGRSKDGQALEIGANVATAQELAAALAQGADGVGLFRTEMLFMGRSAPPSEDEQYAVYAEAARAAAGRPVIIRTIDVGGDKPLAYLPLGAETNPFLGYRGVRIYREHYGLFATQVRAILRAAARGNIWLMVPMIASVEEVRWVRAEVQRVQAELRAARLDFNADTPLGIMIEVPSTAFVIEQLAQEVAFFSIGTNDLTQYFLAVDRDSSQVAQLYNPLQPAFLRLLEKIISDARRAQRWVGMCGEMARHARHLPLLVGLGLSEISVTASEIPALKAALANLKAADCRAVLRAALAATTPAEVEGLLADFQTQTASHALLDDELIIVDSTSTTKEEAIEELLDAFYVAGRTDAPRSVEEAVWRREAAYATGLGHGFAVPHCKSDAMLANSIGVLRLREPMDWGALDGQPVECVILIAIRESDTSDAHMRVFSKLARKLMHDDFRAGLLAAPDAATLRAQLAEELGISMR